MADKSTKRGIYIYIDGKEVSKSVQAVEKELRILTKEQKNMERGSKEYVAAAKKIAELKSIIRQHKDYLKDVENQYENMTKSSGSFVSTIRGGLMVFAGNLMTKALDKVKEFATAIKEWIGEGTDLAAKAEGVKNAFDKLNNPNLLKNLQKATKGTIGDFELMQSAVQASDYKIPLNDLETLLKFVQVQANRTGADFEKLREQIILGIGRESKQRIDDFGISATELDKKIKTLGKDVAKSDQFRVALIEIINSRLEEQGEIAVTAADKEAQANVKRQNSQMKVGENLLGIKNIWSSLTGSFYDTIGNLADKYLPSLIIRAEEIINKFIDWYNESELLRVNVATFYVLMNTFFSHLKLNIKIALDGLGAFADVMKNLTSLDFKAASQAQSDFLTKSASNILQYSRELQDSFRQAQEFASVKIDPVNLQRTITTTSNNLVTTSDNKDNDIEKANLQQKRVNDALRKLEEQHLKDITKIKQDYLNGDILSEQAYNDAILKQQDKYDEARKKKLQDLIKTISDPSLRIDIAKQIADIEAKALDRQIADKAKKQKDAAKQEQDLLKWNEEETKKIVDASLKYVATEENEAYIKQMELRAAGQLSEAEYQKELTNIQMRYLEERLRINGLTEEQIAKIRREILEAELSTMQDVEDKRKSLLGDDIYSQLTEKMKTIDDALLSGAVTFGEAVMLRVEAYMGAVNDAIQLVGNNLSGAWSNYASAEESSISRRYDKEIKAAEGNSKKQKKLEEQKQKEINAVKAKYADKQFAVAVAQTISSTSVAAMEAYKAMAGIPIVGPALGAAAAAAAIAYGHSQIAVAREQRDAAKEGYFDGGFTGGNDPRTVRGKLPDGSDVHGMEFVANRHSTSNSLLRPVFDVIDEAQRHNTVSSLTKSDLAKALNIPNGYIQGGFTGNAHPTPSTSANTQYDESYERFVDVMERLEERLNYPFEGYVTYKGDDGIEAAELLDEKMMKNVSR